MGKRKEWKFTIGIAAPNQYPDLEVNPTNIYCHMSEEDRLKACVEGLAELLALNMRENPTAFKITKEPDKQSLKPAYQLALDL